MEKLVHWAEVLAKLQKEGHQIHLGGYVALFMTGCNHFGRWNMDSYTRIYHYSPFLEPDWFKDWKINNPNINFIISDYTHFCVPFSQDYLRTTNITFKDELETKEIIVKCSHFELAMLEMIQGQPLEWMYEEEREMMENPFRVEDKRVQNLLESWTNPLTKRIFLYLAREGEVDWYHRLDRSRIDLGEGDMIATPEGEYPMGQYDEEYKLTITPLDEFELIRRGTIDEFCQLT